MGKLIRFIGGLLCFLLFANITSAQERKVEKAVKYYERGEFERVIETLDKTKVTNKDLFYKDYIALKGHAYYEMKDYDKALAAYQTAIDEINLRKVPESVLLQYLDIQYNRENYDACLDLLTKLRPVKGSMYNKKPFGLIEEMCHFSQDSIDDKNYVIGYDSIINIQEWTEIDLGENVISFGGAFYKDSLVFSAYTEYEARSEWELAANEGAVTDDIYEVTNLDLYIVPLDKSKEKTIFSKQISTMKNEGALCFNADYTEMYFTRHYVINDKDNFKIHYAVPNKNGMWVDEGPLNFCSDRYSFLQPRLSPDGTTLYCSSDKPGGRGKLDIYYAKGSGKKWSQPVNIGTGINTPNDDEFPYMRNDSIMIFSSNGHVGFGGFDLHWVNITQKPYRVHNLMSPINSRFNEYCLFGDNKRADRVIFFSERGHDGTTQMASILPDKSVNVKPIPYIMDMVELPKPTIEKKVKLDPSVIEGPELDLAVVEEAPIVPSLKPAEVKEEVEMPDVIVEELKNLQFYFNSYELKEPAKETLKELPLFLKSHPDVRLVISGHADMIGTEQYNMYLSTERARETFRYLTEELKLSSDMFVVEANGEYFPKVVTMDKEEGKINRRVEFKMIKQVPEQGITMRYKTGDNMPELVNNLEILFLENSSGADVVADVHEIKVKDIYRAKTAISIADVAAKYGIDANKIKEVNNLDVDSLKATQIVIIPLN